MKKSTQEFRVTCKRVAGGMPRDPERPHQQEESLLIYAIGSGKTEQLRAASAVKRAMEVMSPMGYDKFSVHLTIGDEERASAETEEANEAARALFLEAARKEIPL